MDVNIIQMATSSALSDAKNVIQNASDFSVEGFDTPSSRDDGYWSVIIGYTPNKPGITQTTTINRAIQMREYKNLLLDSNYNLVKMSPYVI